MVVFGLRISRKMSNNDENKNEFITQKTYYNHKYGRACVAIRETFSKCFNFNRPHCVWPVCVFFFSSFDTFRRV